MDQTPHEALGHNSGRESTDPVDFAYLTTQTFGDAELERELLTLFVAQARRILPTLASLPPDRQIDAAHLLKGSARGIGAWPAAEAANDFEGSDFESAPASVRRAASERLAAAFAAAVAAIEARLETSA